MRWRRASSARRTGRSSRWTRLQKDYWIAWPSGKPPRGKPHADQQHQETGHDEDEQRGEYLPADQRRALGPNRFSKAAQRGGGAPENPQPQSKPDPADEFEQCHHLRSLLSKLAAIHRGVGNRKAPGKSSSGPDLVETSGFEPPTPPFPNNPQNF